MYLLNFLPLSSFFFTPAHSHGSKWWANESGLITFHGGKWAAEMNCGYDIEGFQGWEDVCETHMILDDRCGDASWRRGKVSAEIRRYDINNHQRVVTWRRLIVSLHVKQFVFYDQTSCCCFKVNEDIKPLSLSLQSELEIYCCIVMISNLKLHSGAFNQISWLKWFWGHKSCGCTESQGGSDSGLWIIFGYLWSNKLLLECNLTKETNLGQKKRKI